MLNFRPWLHKTDLCYFCIWICVGHRCPKSVTHELFRETMMRATRILTSAIFASVAAYGIALAAEAMPASVHAMNGMLMDAKGMTLYTWDNDKEANKSSCNGMCLMNWPALNTSGMAISQPTVCVAM